MKVVPNALRGAGLEHESLNGVPYPSTSSQRPLRLLDRCPRARQTPLVHAPELARACGVADVILKDERDRMGLGSFKALGAAYVIACDAALGKAQGATYVTASAGNHGLSVAAGASAFDARAVVYISHQVSPTFADRLAEQGAQVVRCGTDYEESMEEAARAADCDGSILLSDSSWPGYVERPHTLMEGYLVLMEEVFAEIAEPPTHIFLQAGVGGLAGAAAAIARSRWGDGPVIVVVEPAAAPALAASIAAGGPVRADGPASIMGRLDCKEPSLIALKGLARDADFFATISEDEGLAGASLSTRCGLDTTPSGAAGLAALAVAEPHFETLRLGRSARVLAILSETAAT